MSDIQAQAEATVRRLQADIDQQKRNREVAQREALIALKKKQDTFLAPAALPIKK